MQGTIEQVTEQEVGDEQRRDDGQHEAPALSCRLDDEDNDEDANDDIELLGKTNDFLEMAHIEEDVGCRADPYDCEDNVGDLPNEVAGPCDRTHEGEQKQESEVNGLVFYVADQHDL